MPSYRSNSRSSTGAASLPHRLKPMQTNDAAAEREPSAPSEEDGDTEGPERKRRRPEERGETEHVRNVLEDQQEAPNVEEQSQSQSMTSGVGESTDVDSQGTWAMAERRRQYEEASGMCDWSPHATATEPEPEPGDFCLAEYSDHASEWEGGTPFDTASFSRDSSNKQPSPRAGRTPSSLTATPLSLRPEEEEEGWWCDCGQYNLNEVMICAWCGFLMLERRPIRDDHTTCWEPDNASADEDISADDEARSENNCGGGQ